MTVELEVAKGRRIQGLGSNLRVESSRDQITATSSLVTKQKFEELQGTHVGDPTYGDDNDDSVGLGH
ncbi:unnamed protein product [Prunus armeniaca]|uniref:Uncharacterized protein n=1 Tax=Prunus armeniaca TaxID=36596 RepID=A0A6J5TXM8_PRUAR|nr:unnamed protein product [Prunus armeniaca]CAB4298863.1 unnamed protein product [Prunus armeniaca]